MKTYEELTFVDDFIFCKVLTTNPHLCHELLELIIGRKVGPFTRLDKQQPIELTADGKGVRFDVYSEDDTGTVFDCEMQTTENRNLPKRSRYYQGMIDLNLIERGADYSELEEAVQRVKDHKEWRTEYMTLFMRDQEMMRKGAMSTLFSLVEDGDLTIDKAARRVNMKPEEFKEAMEKSKAVSV